MRTRLVLPPKGMRGLTRAAKVELAILHHIQHGLVADGTADKTMLWSWIGGILGWAFIAQHYAAGVDEMNRQVGLVHAVLERRRRTGKIGFSGGELSIAIEGVGHMEDISEFAEKHVALACIDTGRKIAEELMGAYGR